MGKKHWIQGAVKRPGAFTAYAHRQGYNSVTGGAISAGKHSKNPRIRREANFAATMKKIAKKHHRGGSSGSRSANKARKPSRR